MKGVSPKENQEKMNSKITYRQDSKCRYEKKQNKFIQ